MGSVLAETSLLTKRMSLTCGQMLKASSFPGEGLGNSFQYSALGNSMNRG